MTRFAAQLDAVSTAMPYRIVGQVQGVTGLTIEAVDLSLPLGAMCRIDSMGGRSCTAEVIGFRDDRTLLMPLSEPAGVTRGDHIENIAAAPAIWCSDELTGRVIDGYGRCIDGKAPPKVCRLRRIDGRGIRPLERRNITHPIATGIRCVDALHTCGQGQRMGIFSGPGVGKSTLISCIARYTSADISVVCLVGERGREAQEFLTNTLGPEGLRRCVVIVSTSEEPAPLRVRAVKVACTVAEYFRDQGKNVLLLVDSLTRLCHAQRLIGLSAHEPPATKGYPPSVFAMLPQILERAGRNDVGSITGFYTVLVEADDFNEPVPDAVKSISDGHLWLSRPLANRGHYPAIDMLQSISRVRSDVADKDHLRLARRVLSLIAIYQEIEDMVSIGAYVSGANIEHDLAVHARPRINQFLQQDSTTSCSLEESRRQLADLVGWIDQTEKTLRSQPAKSAPKAPLVPP